MKLSGKQRAGAACALLTILLASAPPAYEKASFQGGTQMGYTLGQNGYAWPAVAKDPLYNNNRGGFYLSRLSLETRLDFDSSFSGIALGNLVGMDLQEAYLQKRWGQWVLRAGKFRGAGLKSATGTDEYDRTAVNAPRYARYWGIFKRTLGFRDYGLEVERDFRGRDVRNRVFIHNANGENVANDEPANYSGKATQVLGIDYALDWRISPYTEWGGHIGALADRSWSEFVGTHEGWQAQYWFKSNPIVDASLNHQMDVGRFHMFNEGMILYHRLLPNPVDSSATKSWGISSQVRFEHSERWASLLRYEFYDNTDGLNPDDALHLATLGALYRPAPTTYPGMKFTLEYVRTYEEALLNTYSNDLFYCQLQMVF